MYCVDISNITSTTFVHVLTQKILPVPEIFTKIPGFPSLGIRPFPIQEAE